MRIDAMLDFSLGDVSGTVQSIIDGDFDVRCAERGVIGSIYIIYLSRIIY